MYSVHVVVRKLWKRGMKCMVKCFIMPQCACASEVHVYGNMSMHLCVIYFVCSQHFNWPSGYEKKLKVSINVAQWNIEIWLVRQGFVVKIRQDLLTISSKALANDLWPPEAAQCIVHCLVANPMYIHVCWMRSCSHRTGKCKPNKATCNKLASQPAS